MTESTASGDDRTVDLEWLSLEDDEEILWTGEPDRRTMVPAFVVGIPLSILVIGIFIILGEYLRITNTAYVVTNRGLYRKTGILSRDVQRIDFDKVQNISYNQTALGNYFGYGNVDVSTAGGSGVELQFRAISNPREIQRLITDRIGSRRDATDRESGRTKEDVLAEILAELRAIREAVEAEGGDATTRGDSVEDRHDARRSAGDERR